MFTIILATLAFITLTYIYLTDTYNNVVLLDSIDADVKKSHRAIYNTVGIFKK